MIDRETGYRIAKRIFDVAVSGAGLIITSPLMLGIAASIKHEDGGPVFYTSKRIGTNREIVNLYKFRSMYVDADKHLEELRSENDFEDGPRFKMRNDPRVTKTGKILRKFSLDELPQLFNVLKGNISIIGPRPHSVYEVEKYDERAMERFNVKAGILCYSEVSGRSDLPFNESIDLDLKYVSERSIATDVKIMFMAVKAILRKEGAR